MKQFQVPFTYRSPLISAIKATRRQADKLKKDLKPTALDFGPVHILLARHFGFCYGVENAIEIAYRCIEQNPGKRIFLLSEMIHNPQVNNDLQQKGVRFLQDTLGKQIIPFEELTPEDVVIIPAFGTTLALEAKLHSLGISPEKYNTTCPFVEKVWNRGEALAAKGYSLVIHGKPKHEETRATFSRAAANAPAVVVNDMEEARMLAQFITGEKSADTFDQYFAGRYSEGFDPSQHLKRFGVINQTTQLATDTQAIADHLKGVLLGIAGTPADAFADTRDTLCYATNDNQTAVSGMLEQKADLAIVVGGYNSSNTSHLVELCEEKLPTYFINGPEKLIDRTEVEHYDWRKKQVLTTTNYLPIDAPATIMITSGASCPDALVEQVIERLLEFFPGARSIEEILQELN
ncbi:MAG TPA: 4-hydroxy-3-methylbut-2-enyl diphosphate reductase [Phnomibacter sp.]|nr:4-hydroxy-3-methylbut-2-enyl diphosphate reductase [Phnomibacter sp.]